MIEVRRAGIDDVEVVRSIGLSVWPTTYRPVAGDDYVQFGISTWWSEEAVRRSIKSSWTFLGYCNGEPAGTATVATAEDSARLWKLYVLESFHRRGVATALLLEVLDALPESVLTLNLDYLEGNDIAERFYIANGFQETARVPGDRGLNNVEMRMSRRIGSPWARLTRSDG
jgi:GNAT superfamily N-acetyltransferase